MRLYNDKERALKNRWYNSKLWRTRAKHQKELHPVCQFPGCMQPAAVADHIIPCGLDYKKFKFGKLQSLCHYHHNQKLSDDLIHLKVEERCKIKFF